MKDLNLSAKDRLLTALTALAPDIAAERAAFDRDRRLPDSLFAKLAEAGQFRLLLPRDAGGSGLSLFEFQDVVEAAGALDGSVGWLIGNGGGMARAGGYLMPTARRAIFGNPLAFIVATTGATGRALPVAGGYRVSGRWPFGSGAHHGTFFAAVCEVDEGRPHGQGRRILAYMPRESVTVLDTWHVGGLRGTGSCDFEVADLPVAEDFTHDFQAVPTVPGVIYRLPAISAFAWTVSTVPLGIATAARRAFVGLAVDHKRFGGATTLAQREVVQCEVGRIEARVAAARALLRETMGQLCAETEAGNASERARVTFRTACTLVGETAVEAVSKYCEMAGAAAIFESSALERCDRDVRTATKHVAMSQAAYVTGGMAELGLDISKMRF